MRGCKLATYWQDFTENNIFSLSENIAKSFRGLLFDSHYGYVYPVNHSINLFSNNGPKGLLQVATKYNIAPNTIHLCVYTHISSYTHPQSYIHTYTVYQKNVVSNF